MRAARARRQQGACDRPAPWGGRYKKHTASLRCYAGRFGYTFRILRKGDYGKCEKYHTVRDVFFMKHCLVAEYMEEQPPDAVMVVLDADVVPVTLARGFDEWLVHDADLQFYDRMPNVEVAAGNYVARNTPFARDFLRSWASWARRVPRGFSSGDNGAIHLHLVQVLGFQETGGECHKLYDALVAGVDNLDPYFAFVQCCRDALGPNGERSPRLAPPGAVLMRRSSCVRNARGAQGDHLAPHALFGRGRSALRLQVERHPRASAAPWNQGPRIRSACLLRPEQVPV